MQKSYKAVNGQSIYDVCLNAYTTLDNLVKLLVDSGGGQGVDDIPQSGQIYYFDDDLVADQAVQQAYTLSGIYYATLMGANGSTYYTVNQNPPTTTPPTGGDDPGIPPTNPGNMGIAIESTYFTASADGTTVIVPQDKDGNSMIGYEIIQIEKEIRPIENPVLAPKWVWNKPTGTLTLTNGESVDAGVTLFILYSKPTS